MLTATSQDGTTLAYDRIGTGPALILVAGATATRGAAQSLSRVLGTDFTVYVYDRRGRGDSGDTLPSAPEREYEDLAAMIDVAGGEAFVFGHSSGAILALRAAASGLPIPKLAVYEPPFIVNGDRAPVPDEYVAHLNALLAEGRKEDALIYFNTAAVGIPEQFIDQMKQHPFWRGAIEAANTIPYDGMICGDTMSGKPLGDHPWADITIPTLVLDGGASFPFMHAAAESLLTKLPDGTGETLPGQDHGPADDVLAPVLTRFYLGRN